MAEGNAELKQKALATLRAGRRELDAEAGWLRHELDVKRIASDFTAEHIHTMLVVALGVGVTLPWLVLGARDKEKTAPTPRQIPADPKKVKADTPAYLAGLLLKMATPIVLKEGLGFIKRFTGHRGNGSRADRVSV